MSVTPFVRYESFDTQSEVPDGFVSDPENDTDILTVGLNVQPIDSIVFKVDVQDLEHGPDAFNLSLGYVF